MRRMGLGSCTVLFAVQKGFYNASLCFQLVTENHPALVSYLRALMNFPPSSLHILSFFNILGVCSKVVFVLILTLLSNKSVYGRFSLGLQQCDGKQPYIHVNGCYYV